MDECIEYDPPRCVQCKYSTWGELEQGWGCFHKNNGGGPVVAAHACKKERSETGACKPQGLLFEWKRKKQSNSFIMSLWSFKQRGSGDG